MRAVTSTEMYGRIPRESFVVNWTRQSSLNMDYMNSAHYELRTKTLRAQMCDLEACSEHMIIKLWDYSGKYHTVVVSLNHYSKKEYFVLDRLWDSLCSHICV